MDDSRHVWLDAIRAACALAVCAGHLRAATIVDHSRLDGSSLPLKLFYLSTGLGHQAVIVFFVLSGFFVGGAALRRDSFHPARYAIARLTRLWIVLIPALVATALVDLAIAQLAPEVLAGAYASTWNSGPMPATPYVGDAITFVANLFFLQTIVAPVYGTNAPLWSLANEFWYYALFAAILIALRGGRGGGSRSTIARVSAAISAVAMIAWLPGGLLEGFVVWGMGLVVHASIGRLGRAAATATTVLGAICFAGSLAYAKSAALQVAVGLSPDLMVGLGFSVLAIGLVNRPERRSPWPRFDAASRVASECSYSLYLIHFPIVALIGGTLYSAGKRLPDLQGLAGFFAWLAVLLAVGYAFYWLIERHTEAVRRRIEAGFSIGR